METSQDEDDDDDGMEDAERYEDWPDNEIRFMMVDEEIMQKVRNKTLFHMVDTQIYLEEVACITDVLESIRLNSVQWDL